MSWLKNAVQGAAGLTLALGLALGPWALAQAVEEKPPTTEAATAVQEQENPATKLEDVVVRGAGEPFTGIEATSATVLDNAQIVDRVYVTPLDILKLSPGITIQQFNQGGIPRGVQMRRFPWVSHGSDGAIFLDGVPLNDVGADTNQIIPEEVERVEIIKGPASALYGNYASAGTIHFRTFQAGDFTRLKMQYGSFNTEDMTGVLARRDGNWDHVYSGEIYHSDGYQDNSKWDKQIGAGRWTYHCGERLDASLGVRAYHSTWDAPGTIPQFMYDSNPSGSVSDVNGGWKDRELGQGSLQFKLSDSSKLTWSAWAMNQELGRWYQAWVSPTQKTGSNFGYEYIFNSEYAGSKLAYNYLGEVLERETRLELGLDWQRSQERREYWRLLTRQGRTKGAKYQDDDITIDSAPVYGELNYQLFQKLRMVLGSRYDTFNGSLERMDHSTDENDGPKVYSPKVGLIFTPMEGLELFANYCKGFQLPYLPDYITKFYLEPAIRTQYEAGLKTRPNKWSDFSLAFWRLNTTDDFQPSLLDPNVQENAGETRREGIEAEANLRPWKHLVLHLDYAYIQTEYLNYYDGTKNRDGNSLPYVPHNIFNAEIAWQPPRGLGARLGYRYQTTSYIDAANTMEMDAFGVAKSQVSYRFNKRYKLALDVINLFNNKYAEYVGSSTDGKVYTPGDPLSAYLTFTIDW